MKHPADRSVVALPEVPGMGSAYLRTLTARRGRSGLEAVEVRVDDVQIDAEHLADYQRLLGEPVADAAPAGYLFVLAFPLMLSVMTRKGFPLRAIGMVHVANHIAQNHPVRIGESIGLRTWAEDLRAHRSGTQVNLVTQALDADGDVAWEQVATFLAKGVRIEGLPAADDGASRPEFDAPVPTAQWRLDRADATRYAAVSGDRNPIHLHPLLAKAFGFPRTVAHGMYTAARALAAVGAERGDSYTWDVAFGRPVLLPSTVAVRVAHPDVDAASTQAAEPPVKASRGRKPTRSTPSDRASFEIVVWDPRSGKPHLTGSVTPIV